jgi:hypothetical protein
MSYYPERRHPRFEFDRFPLVFTLQLAEPSWPDRPLRVEARNISRSGLKYLSNRKFPLFSQVSLIFFDRGEGKELASLTGKVVRLEEIDTGVGERTYGVAVEFLTGQAALEALIPGQE